MGNTFPESCPSKFSFCKVGFNETKLVADLSNNISFFGIESAWGPHKEYTLAHAQMWDCSN